MLGTTEYVPRANAQRGQSRYSRGHLQSGMYAIPHPFGQAAIRRNAWRDLDGPRATRSPHDQSTSSRCVARTRRGHRQNDGKGNDQAIPNTIRSVGYLRKIHRKGQHEQESFKCCRACAQHRYRSCRELARHIGQRLNPGNSIIRKISGIEPGHLYGIEVRAIGDKIMCLAVGAKFFEHSSNELSRGRVGLRSGGPFPMRFRNLKVTTPEGELLWEGFPGLETNR